MALLKSLGYIGVSLSAGLDLLQLGNARSPLQRRGEGGFRPGDLTSPNPERSVLNPQPIALTFDDGFSDFYTEALPVLAEFGFTATMYLPTSFIQEPRRAFKKTECMTWSEVRDAQRLGVRFGAHTVTHPVLYHLAWPELEAEVRDSRLDIEQRLGTPVTSFAYPYAFPEADRVFCRRFRETLITSGYLSCVTTRAGRVAIGDDPYTLRRLPVNGEDDPLLLLAKLSGAYDWMHPAQRSVKRLKHLKRIVALGSSRRDSEMKP